MRDTVFIFPIILLILLSFSIEIDIKRLIIIFTFTLHFYFYLFLHNTLRLVTTYLEINITDYFDRPPRIQIQTRDPIPRTPWEHQEPINWNQREPIGTSDGTNVDP